MDTAIVLGAGGFLGQYICREFYRQGHKVIGFGRHALPSGFCSRVIRGDLLQDDLAELLTAERPRWLINAAGGASVGDSFVAPYSDWQKTVQVQAKILEALRETGSTAFYIFLSSAAVYGEPNQLPVTETTPCQPISPYGMHKWQAELMQEEYRRFFGVRSAVLRIFSAYGAGLRRQVVYELCQKIRQAQTVLEVYGSGEESRDFIHADDVAGAVACVAQSEAEGIFNVGSGVQTSIAALARALVDQIRPDLSIVFTGNERPGNPLKWQADISKLQRLQFACKVPPILQQGKDDFNCHEVIL